MKKFKCPIINVDSPDRACGYGEGSTFAEAKTNALSFARMMHRTARFNKSTGTVEFRKKNKSIDQVWI